MYLSCGGVLNFMAFLMALHANACKRPWYLLPLFVSFSQNFCEARACNGREVMTTASSSFTSQRTVLCSSPLSRKEWSAFASWKKKKSPPLNAVNVFIYAYGVFHLRLAREAVFEYDAVARFTETSKLSSEIIFVPKGFSAKFLKCNKADNKPPKKDIRIEIILTSLYETTWTV